MIIGLNLPQFRLYVTGAFNGFAVKHLLAKLLLIMFSASLHTSVLATSEPSAYGLVGTVSSKTEGAMEGVLVIAKAQGETVLIAVSTNAAGQFQFNRDRLKPGQYSLSVRAAGFELSDAASKIAKSVTVRERTQATLDLSLAPVTDPQRLAAQLTTLDWVRSFPGSDTEKDLLVRNMVNCGFCHTLERVARSPHTSESFRHVIQRMHTYETDHSSADLIHVVRRPQPLDGMIWYGRQASDIADYLASINLSPSQGNMNTPKASWDYPLQTLPLPTGEATEAVVTVFPIPRQPSVIHDLDVDSNGNVWYGNTGWDYIGKLDPRSGEFSEWPAPNFLPAVEGAARLVGVQDIQVDASDKIWVAIGGNKHAVFDPKSQQWDTFDLPVIWKNPFLSPIRAENEALWATAITTPPDGDKLHEHAFRLDTKNGELGAGINLFDRWESPKDVDRVGQLNYCYMMDQDMDGNFLCTVPEASAIARTDSGGKVRLIPTPTPHAYPRRGYRDEKNRFWFGEFFADKVGYIDLETDEIKEYDIQPKYISPYYARPDRTGKIWISSVGSDRLLRLNPATGDVVQYLMPVTYDARKVVVDNNADRITVWLPNKNLGQLVRVEVAE